MCADHMGLGVRPSAKEPTSHPLGRAVCPQEPTPHPLGRAVCPLEPTPHPPGHAVCPKTDTTPVVDVAQWMLVKQKA